MTKIKKAEHNKVITDSWKRSESHGLDTESKPKTEQLPAGELKDAKHAYNFLLGTTNNDVLPHYANILSNSRCLIMMADQNGQILNCWGNTKSIKTPDSLEQNFAEGSNWSELIRGTNAIGTAIATGQAVQVQQDEHYLKCNRFMTGSAAPIYDTNDKLVAVLDVSSDAYLPQMHTLGMVKMMSQSVENRLMHNQFWSDDFLLSFNTSPDTLDSQWIGLIAFNESGTIISANRRAQMLLRHELALQSVDNIFHTKLFELKNAPEGAILEVMALGKYKMYATVQKPERPFVLAPDYRKTPKPEPDTSNKLCPEESYSEPRLQRNFAMAQSVLDKSIPILLVGETSTGKTTFAHKLHKSSTKAPYPFIQVNCSTLKSSEIDQLLYGEDSENFDSIGAIRQSNKGILFLHEVGEFPIVHQSKLLKVFNDCAVTPVNGSKSYSVNLTIIASSQHDLKTKLASGDFRDDLYYHLAGLCIDIPALRQRSDLNSVMTELYCQQQTEHQAISDEVLTLLSNHSWPGNFKQLKYTLAVAATMAQSSAIEPWHLPDSFLNEIKAPPPKEIPINHQTTSSIPTKNHMTKASLNDSIKDETLNQYTIHQGNITRAAKALGISRNTLYKRLKELGIKP